MYVIIKFFSSTAPSLSNFVIGQLYNIVSICWVVSNETENGKWKTENGKRKRKILTKTENGNFPENFFGKWQKVLENDLATCKFR